MTRPGARSVSDWRERFSPSAVVVRGEGGAVHLAEVTEGQLVLIRDEGALASFMDVDDLGDLVGVTRYQRRELARCAADVVGFRRIYAPYDDDWVDPASQPAPHDELLARLVRGTADRLEALAEERGLKTVNERDHLQPCSVAAARELLTEVGGECATQHAVSFGDWPRLGDVDLALLGLDAAPLLLELKCGNDLNALGPCVWDAAKLAMAVQEGVAAGAFLLAAAPRSRWEQPVRGAEFFEHLPHDIGLLRVLYADWWRSWERRGDPQPSFLPRRWWTEDAHVSTFTVAAQPWELRLAEVVVRTSDVVVLPPLVR